MPGSASRESGFVGGHEENYQDLLANAAKRVQERVLGVI